MRDDQIAYKDSFGNLDCAGYEEDYKTTPVDMQKLRRTSMEAVESPRSSYSATFPHGEKSSSTYSLQNV